MKKKSIRIPIIITAIIVGITLILALLFYATFNVGAPLSAVEAAVYALTVGVVGFAAITVALYIAFIAIAITWLVYLIYVLVCKYRQDKTEHSPTEE